MEWLASGSASPLPLETCGQAVNGMVFNLLPSEGGKAEQPAELSLLFPRNGGIPSLLLKTFKPFFLLLRLQGSIWSTSTGKSGFKKKIKSHSSVTWSAMTLWKCGERMPLTILKEDQN